jgi:hypothetical protein
VALKSGAGAPTQDSCATPNKVSDTTAAKTNPEIRERDAKEINLLMRTGKDFGETFLGYFKSDVAAAG